MKNIPFWEKVYILSLLLQITIYTLYRLLEHFTEYGSWQLIIFPALHLMIFAVTLLTPSFFRRKLDRRERWGMRILSPGFWYFLGWAALMFMMTLLAFNRRQGIEPG
jgi:hypothetical protein